MTSFMNNRLFARRLSLCLTACGLATGAAMGSDPTISVTPASAPNAFGSPSWAGWVSNAVYAIENGLPAYGTPGTPEYYHKAGATMGIRRNLVTSFPSWKGSASPAIDYGAPFASELGNRLHFGLHILGNGTQFSISQLSFVADSTDAGDTLDFSFGEGSYNYSTSYVGIDYVDGIKGNGDDIIITGGLNTQLVDELVGRGSGNAWWPIVPDDGATPDEAIKNVIAGLNTNTPFYFTGTYSLNMGDESFLFGSGQVEFIPAPGAVALLGLGGFACAGRRRR